MRFSSSFLAAAAIAAAMLPDATPLAAQADGTPIRVQTAVKPRKWITGRAAGITADSIGVVQSHGTVLARSYDTLRYARAELHRMEVSRGHESNAGRGALIGGGIGLVLGVACVAATDDDDWAGCEGGGEVAVFTLGFGGLGALLGALSHHEIWGEVPVDSDAVEPPGQ